MLESDGLHLLGAGQLYGVNRGLLIFGVLYWGVPKIRNMAFWGLHRGSLVMGTAQIYGATNGGGFLFGCLLQCN